MDTPPPPPPHGEVPKSSGLPPGKYDIFIIPQHSSGSGFLYLPSLKPNTNSFAAGFASALILVAVVHASMPIFQAWWNGLRTTGGPGMFLIIIGAAVGAWSLGRMQNGGANAPGTSGNGSGDAAGDAPPGRPPPHGGSGYSSQSHSRGDSGNAPPGAGNGYTAGLPPGGWGTPPSKPGTGWKSGGTPHTAPPPHTPGGFNTGTPPNNTNHNTPPPRPTPQSNNSGWERARQETKRKEDERKKAQELKRQKEETERKLQEQKEEAERKLREAREKEQQERAAREAVRERIAREARQARAARDAKETQAKKEKEAKEAVEKKAAEEAKKAEQDEAASEATEKKRKVDAWAKAKAQAEARREAARKKEAEEAAARTAATGIDEKRKSAYAYSAMGDEINPWPQEYPTVPASVSASASPRAAPGSAAAAAAAMGRPPRPSSTKRDTATDSEYSYRPYDTPKPSTHRKVASSIYSASSYQSGTTSATSPPPSMRGPYTTKDPDKIVIKAVYAFNNAFNKTPTSQLVPGTGRVTDGLILRITTEGLFIDDDINGDPLRAWDIKAWTLKLVEVWCPTFPSGFATEKKQPPPQKFGLWGNNSKPKDSDLQNGDADAMLVEFLTGCKERCHQGRSTLGQANRGASSQTGEHKLAHLHVLRVNIRDQEGRKYVFVVGEEEGWKVAIGLQRLRRGTQVRALGVSGMSKSDCSGVLTNLGWLEV